MCPPSALHPSDTSDMPTETAATLPILSSKVSKAAYDLAYSLLPPAILNHSIRVYLLAKALGDRSDSTYIKDAAKHDLLFTACILHDIGTTSEYDGPQRFEVEGADAAASLLRLHGIPEEDAHQVWMAIALHTSPHIAERINELSKLVREAVLLDFGKGLSKLEAAENVKRQMEERYPRLGIEKVLGDAVVEQAVKKPQKAPAASWPNNLYRAYVAEPEWEGVNKGF